jgi:anaerobic ribonucleoside-triphosphate reductase
MTRDSKTAPIAQETERKSTVPSLKDEDRTKCEIWCRCMGYFRPVSHYNIGKKQEFADRVNFKEPKGE